MVHVLDSGSSGTGSSCLAGFPLFCSQVIKEDTSRPAHLNFFFSSLSLVIHLNLAHSYLYLFILGLLLLLRLFSTLKTIVLRFLSV